jgi:hypothetical protein
VSLNSEGILGGLLDLFTTKAQGLLATVVIGRLEVLLVILLLMLEDVTVADEELPKGVLLLLLVVERVLTRRPFISCVGVVPLSEDALSEDAVALLKVRRF